MNDFTEEYVVRYGEADRHNRLKLRALFDYSQETAGLHTRRYGLDTMQIHARNHAWILSRIKYRILSYPGVHDVVRVRTYPSGFDRLFAQREFRFHAASGEVFAMASSDWLLMDLAGMRILNARKEVQSAYPDGGGGDGEVFFPDLGKLPGEVAGADWEARYEIHETMLDVNNHLNNAEYAGFVQDFLGEGRIARDLQINFQASVPPGSVLEVRGRAGADGGFLALGYLGERVAFQACGTFAVPGPAGDQ